MSIIELSQILKTDFPKKEIFMTRDYSHYLDLLKTGTLRQKSTAIMAVAGFADENKIDIAIEALEAAFTSLLDAPDVSELFWRKTIEGGVRSYSRLVAIAFEKDLTSRFGNQFLAIMRRILSIEDEEIIGCALTAMYQDAPVQSLQLLDDLRKLRAANPSHIQRIGFLFDRCETKLVEVRA